MPQVSLCDAPPGECGHLPHFPFGLPHPEWFPEQLMAYIQVQHQAIVDQDRALAVNYWRLGKALEALRKTFAHGQWEQFLKTAELDKSHVFRARAIARTFAQETELVGLTAHEAYQRRTRKQPVRAASPSVPAATVATRFVRCLEQVDRLVEPFVDAAGFEVSGTAATLLPKVQQILDIFRLIHTLL